MSEKEHDQKTEEMFDVVNSHATQEARRQAERVTEQMKTAEDVSARTAREHQAAVLRAKRIFGLAMRMLICIVSAGMFLAALVIPDWVPVLCIAGIAICLIAGTVAIDRCIRSWR